MKQRTIIALLLLAMIMGAVLPALAREEAAPVAKNDELGVLINKTNAFGAGQLFADNGSGPDDLGTPEATVVSFGISTATETAAGGTIDLAGGKLTVNADGSLVLDKPTATNLTVFFYRISNEDGHDDASVTFRFSELPSAKKDEYTFSSIINQNKGAADGLFADNGFGADALGIPQAAIVSFGSGSAGGSVDSYAAGTGVPFAGGTLTVNADGSWSLTDAPFDTGVFDFRYRLANSAGNAIARVFFSIQTPPVAWNDNIDATLGVKNIYPAGKLFEDNGGGEDVLGAPEATIVSFGGGSLGGSVADNAAGTTVPFAATGGTLEVRADGSLTIDGATNTGVYTFLYRLENAQGASDASVTVTISGPPKARDDAYSFSRFDDQAFNMAAGLFANNGSGVDVLGAPAATLYSYGGGDIGGAIADNLAGQPVALAGGTLIVYSDGSWSLSGAPFETGNYKFGYVLKNSGGVSNAQVNLEIKGRPRAMNDDLLTALGDFEMPAGGLFNDNGFGPDDRSTPPGNIVTFGGGSLGGLVTDNAAGSTVPFTGTGGTLQVNANGSLKISGATNTGIYTFDYSLGNSIGVSEATVTVTISKLPAAKNDKYIFFYQDNQAYPQAGGLFANNGSGADFLGDPAAALVSFGGGDLGGSVDDLAPGSEADLAAGKLVVNSDGSWALTGQPFSPGDFKFSYRLENEVGSSTAEVTLTILQFRPTFLPVITP